jgi:hypothetical protein
VKRALVAVALLSALVACSGDDDDDAAPASTTTTGEDQGDVLFSDDLLDDDGGWGEGDESGYRRRLEGGALVIETERVDEGVAVWPDALGIDVLDAVTTVTLEADGGSGAVGAACRASDDGFYALGVDQAGTARIEKWERTQDDPPLVLATSDAGVADRSGVFTATCTGGGEDESPVELTLAVDGEEVLTAQDDQGLPSGYTGVYAVAATGDTLSLRVEQFEVAAVPGGTTRQSPPEPFEPLPPEGYRESFDGAEPGFGTLEIDDDRGGYLAVVEDGRYRMRVDGYIQRSAPVDPIPNRAVAEVTATKRSDGEGLYGLTWAADRDHFWEVTIDEGFAAIGAVEGEDRSYVELDSRNDVDAITGTDDRIVTEIDRTTPGRVRITLTVNGSLVLSVDDEDRFGTIHFSQLYIASTDDEGVLLDVAFDDYRLTAPA